MVVRLYRQGSTYLYTLHTKTRQTYTTQHTHTHILKCATYYKLYWPTFGRSVRRSSFIVHRSHIHTHKHHTYMHRNDKFGLTRGFHHRHHWNEGSIDDDDDDDDYYYDYGIEIEWNEWMDNSYISATIFFLAPDTDVLSFNLFIVCFYTFCVFTLSSFKSLIMEFDNFHFSLSLSHSHFGMIRVCLLFFFLFFVCLFVLHLSLVYVHVCVYEISYDDWYGVVIYILCVCTFHFDGQQNEIERERTCCRFCLLGKIIMGSGHSWSLL